MKYLFLPLLLVTALSLPAFGQVDPGTTLLGGDLNARFLGMEFEDSEGQKAANDQTILKGNFSPSFGSFIGEGFAFGINIDFRHQQITTDSGLTYNHVNDWNQGLVITDWEERAEDQVRSITNISGGLFFRYYYLFSHDKMGVFAHLGGNYAVRLESVTQKVGADRNWDFSQAPELAGKSPGTGTSKLDRDGFTAFEGNARLGYVYFLTEHLGLEGSFGYTFRRRMLETDSNESRSRGLEQETDFNNFNFRIGLRAFLHSTYE